jgi:hypothetical protein
VPKMPKVVVRLRRVIYLQGMVISSDRNKVKSCMVKKLKLAAPKAHSLTLGTLIYFSSL